eukprot:jgi/Mesen1/5054/ME000252S04167
MAVQQSGSTIILGLFVLCGVLSARAADPACQNIVTFNGQTKTYSLCSSLALSGSIAWNWTADGVLSLHFENTPQSANGWVAWGVSDNGKMPGSSALVCYPSADGQGALVKQYKLGDYFASPTNPGGSLNVSQVACEITDSGNLFKIQLVVRLNSNPQIYQVWGKGPGADATSGALRPHNPANNFGAPVNFLSGQAGAASSGHRDFKNVRAPCLPSLLPLPLHARAALFDISAARAVGSWGAAFLLAVYAMATDGGLTGYILGVVGFAYGVKLIDWDVVERLTHRNLGIAIFVFATLQITALIFRPKKDSGIRTYWNIYHHFSGYLVIVLGIVNCFYGFHVLETYGNWRKVYIVALACLGGLALVLEAITWVLYFTRERSDEPEEALKPRKQKLGNAGEDGNPDYPQEQA